MDGDIVGALLIHMVPLGIAASLSPVPIITGVTLTGTLKPRVAVGAYVLGGVLVYAVVATIAIAFFGDSSEFRTHNHPSTLSYSLKTAIGAFFLLAALVSLITSRRQRERKVPRWMATIENFGPTQAFLAGIIILSPKLKNILLLAAAITAIGAAHVGVISGGIALALFVTITLAPVLAPLVVQLTQPPERAAALTRTWKGWLERNNQLLLAVVFAVMGLKLLEDGLTGLLS